MNSKWSWSRLRMFVMPRWVAGPLTGIGFLDVLAKPFGMADNWTWYGYTVAIGVLVTAVSMWFYELTYVERTPESVTMRLSIRRRKSPSRGSTEQRPLRHVGWWWYVIGFVVLCVVVTVIEHLDKGKRGHTVGGVVIFVALVAWALWGAYRFGRRRSSRPAEGDAASAPPR